MLEKLTSEGPVLVMASPPEPPSSSSTSNETESPLQFVPNTTRFISFPSIKVLSLEVISTPPFSQYARLRVQLGSVVAVQVCVEASQYGGLHS